MIKLMFISVNHRENIIQGRKLQVSYNTHQDTPMQQNQFTGAEIPPSRQPLSHNCYTLSVINTDLEQCPRARFEHISIFYKNKIYIFGGLDAQGQSTDNRIIHYYCLDKKIWVKLETTSDDPSFIKFRGTYGAAVGSRFVVIGTELQPSKDDQLKVWRLMLDPSLDWKPQQYRGEPPKAANGACLISIEKNYLVFFGGQYQEKFQNIIYLYHTDSKNWTKCAGSYQYSLKARTHASMAYFNSKIYLYGGYYKGPEALEELDDFYEISVRLPSKGVQSYAQVTKINCPLSPPSRAQHFLMPISDSDLVLFGGKNQEQTDDSVWRFSNRSQSWEHFGEFADRQILRQSTTPVFDKNSIWIFGGAQSISGDAQTMEARGDLLRVTLNLQTCKLPQQVLVSNSCKLCYQQRHNFDNHCLQFPSCLIEEIVQMNEFPFAAFGLLIDNAMMQGATIISVRIELQQAKHYIRIDDNGKSLWSSEQIIKEICSFGALSNPITVGDDKKTKKNIHKLNSLHEFGLNLKLGCLRLGKSFLFVSSMNKQLRVISFYKNAERNTYVVDYYILDTTTKEVTQKWMTQSRKLIEQKYYKQIRQVYNNKSITNSVFVFDTIINDPHEHLNVALEYNDIFLGPNQQIELLRSSGYRINECIDVSLKSYLSALYLRCDSLQLTLNIAGISSFILVQGVLEKVDKLLKAGAAVELEELFDFDFKHAELFYLRDLNKAGSFFSNGLLFYNHNRLITRFRLKLGTLLTVLNSQTSDYSNSLPLFGYAQLPEGVIVNPFKSNFCFNVMLETLETRCKFIEETFKRKLAQHKSLDVQESASKRREKPSLSVVTGVKQLPWNLRHHAPLENEVDKSRHILGVPEAVGNEKSSQLIASPVVAQAQPAVHPPSDLQPLSKPDK